MGREAVLRVRVPPVGERIRGIEEEPLPPNIGDLLDAAAAEVPDQLAWDFFEQGDRITYGELKARVDRLAAGMARVGIRPGTHVGVMLPNVAAMPLSWLALMRLGAVMVPMNVDYTAREIKFVVENGDVRWMIIEHDCVERLVSDAAMPGGLQPANIFVHGAPIDGFGRWDELPAADAGAVDALSPPSLDSVANIQYTSGTTGFPKGCILTHRYWLTVSKVNARRDGMRYRNILCATPFFYMDPQWLLLMTFWQRGRLFVARRQSPSRFMGWVREHHINFCLLPYLVIKQPESPDDRKHELIRCNVYGIPKGLHKTIEDRFDLIAREAFGMTETGSCLFMPIEATDMVGSGSCGKPGPFREARIVGEDGRVVATGEIGELQVRGPGIFKGYYRNPEATAAVFDGVWFRTGDLFRQDEHGYLYIVGRVKDMIRRAGENIAAREVESVVAGLPGVREAAAVAVPDPVRGEEVKIYVQLQPGVSAEDLPPSVIIAHCEANLARFKVPRFVAYQDEFPKTPSGKVSKAVLRSTVADLRANSFDRVEGKWL